MTASNGKLPVLDNSGDNDDREFIPMPAPKPRFQIPPKIRVLILGSGQFSITRTLILMFLGWAAFSQVPRLLERTETPAQATAPQLTYADKLRADRTYKGVMFRVSESYAQTSQATRADATQAMAKVYIDHADEKPDPYAYLVQQMNDRLYDLNQMKGAKLIWKGTDIEQAAKLQLHLDALAMAMNSVAQGSQSDLDSTVDLIQLSKAVDAQNGIFLRQVIPAITDPPPPKPERGFNVPPWMEKLTNPKKPQEEGK